MGLIDIFGHPAFAEWVFGIVVIATCFLIYFKTKKFYELSVKHSGIKYFRYVFLYLGLTHIVRLILTLVIVFPNKIFLINTYIFIFSLGVYTSALAFFYLILMFFWGKLGDTLFSNWILIHFISASFAIISMVHNHLYLLAVFQIGILIALAIMVIETKIKDRGENSLPMMFLLYSMVFGHWVLISILQFMSDFYPQVRIFIYIITFVFLVTLIWKLLSHIGVNNEKKITLNRKGKA